MLSLARWCGVHRRLVVVLWIAVLVGTGALSRVVGSHYGNNFSLPGTDAQRAADLLDRHFPAQAGDREQIVLHARSGSLADPGVRAAAGAMLLRVARLPHVVSVAGPFAPGGARAVSRDGRTAYANVVLDERANVVPTSAVRRVIDVARAAASVRLQVELGGQAVEQAQRSSVGSTFVGLAAAVVVLLVSFGSFLAMGLPIVTALFGLGTGLGLIGLASRVLGMADFSSQLALMIGLGVGVDYALFIVTRYRDAYRENGGDVDAAIELAMNTAGRAVIFAGITVVIALMGMCTIGIGFLYGLAVAASLAVLLVLAASLTLLPALLRFSGTRIGKPGVLARRRPREATARRGFWERWIDGIQRRPWLATLGAAAVMLVLASPALGIRLGNSDAGNDPASTTTRRAYDLLAAAFGPGSSGPLLLAVRLPHAGDTAVLVRLRAALVRTPGVASVAAARVSPDGSTATVSVVPVASPQSEATSRLVDRLRRHVLPPVAAATGSAVYVGGVTAAQIDFSNVLAGKLWLFIGAVVLLSAVLLLVVFRSLVIPVQAAVMNLLSIGSSLGVVVAVFQWGWLGSLFGVQGGPIAAFLPVMVFAIVFGLSMDYEVFLVSRIHEEWLVGGDARRAVHEGLVRTGRVITAAAAVMVVVFGSFILGGDRVIELFGLGLASAVFLDALVIRCLLLPGALVLLGRSTWAIPAWLDRRLPRVALEPSRPAPAEPVAHDAPATLSV